MNKKAKILGAIHLIIGGGGMLVCMAAYLCWIKLASDAHSLRTAHTLGQMMFILSMCILLPSLACGIGLLREKPWGRVVAIGWSMLLLLVVPIGTLLGGYGLWVLLKQTPVLAYPVGSGPHLVQRVRTTCATLSHDKHDHSQPRANRPQEPRDYC